MKKRFLAILAAALLPSCLFAQFGVVSPLHVNGNQLNDAYGNKVVLHGVMDTPSPYFNKYRWGYSCTDNNISACISYYDKIFGALQNPAKGTYCNIFRLHLEPGWTNDPNKKSTGSDTGEANISRFSASRLQKYLDALYLPIAQKAINHGLYVVIRPPGVCPKDLKVGDAYQNYLKTVWNIVSSNSWVKNNSGIVSLELANEPVHIYNRYGQSSATAMRDYFQPVVDVIRKNGFKGIIWIPGTGYQSQYENYASYPVSDSNFGYAVHVYPGWYGASDTSYDSNAFIYNFQKQVPVVKNKPILVSEIDWSPEKPGAGKYNEFGQWVASNLVKSRLDWRLIRRLAVRPASTGITSIPRKTMLISLLVRLLLTRILSLLPVLLLLAIPRARTSSSRGAMAADLFLRDGRWQIMALRFMSAINRAVHAS